MGAALGTDHLRWVRHWGDTVVRATRWVARPGKLTARVPTSPASVDAPNSLSFFIFPAPHKRIHPLVTQGNKTLVTLRMTNLTRGNVLYISHSTVYGVPSNPQYKYAGFQAPWLVQKPASPTQARAAANTTTPAPAAAHTRIAVVPT